MATSVTKAENLGNDVVAFGWMSATGGMTNPQKLAYAKGMLTAAAPPVPVDLNISG